MTDKSSTSQSVFRDYVKRNIRTDLKKIVRRYQSFVKTFHLPIRLGVVWSRAGFVDPQQSAMYIVLVLVIALALSN